MTRLPGEPGSAEFAAKLRALDARGAAKPSPGTLGGLIARYRASPEFAALAPRTRSDYQIVFDRLSPLDEMPLLAITSEFLYALRDKFTVRTTANKTLKVLRLLFNWGRRRGICKENPAEAVETIRRPRGAPLVNRPWTGQELALVLQKAQPWMRVPIALAAYTGMRESDVATVTWAAYDGERFRVRVQKTGATLAIPAHRRLREILDVTPRRAVTIVTGARGQPMTADVLRNAFFRLMRQLGMPGLSLHGLRHTLGTAIIEAGGTRAMAQALLGHATERSSEHYSRHADQRQLAEAAVQLLENRMENRPVSR